MDPEEWAEIMNGAFEHMIQPVDKHEGIVARLMGDAIWVSSENRTHMKMTPNVQHWQG